MQNNFRSATIDTAVTIPAERQGIEYSGTLVTFRDLKLPEGFREIKGLVDPHAMIFGDFPMDEKPLVRVHSGCITGDVWGSKRCDCGPQLQESIQRMKQEGGIILYMPHHEGRGIGLNEKNRAY